MFSREKIIILIKANRGKYYSSLNFFSPQLWRNRISMKHVSIPFKWNPKICRRGWKEAIYGGDKLPKIWDAKAQSKLLSHFGRWMFSNTLKHSDKFPVHCLLRSSAEWLRRSVGNLCAQFGADWHGLVTQSLFTHAVLTWSTKVGMKNFVYSRSSSCISLLYTSYNISIVSYT